MECQIGAVPSVGDIGRSGITGIGKLLENPSCSTHSSSTHDGNWVSDSLVSSAYCLLSWSTCLRKTNPSSVLIWYDTGPVTLTILTVIHFSPWKFLAYTFSPTSIDSVLFLGYFSPAFHLFAQLYLGGVDLGESSTSSPLKVGLERLLLLSEG